MKKYISILFLSFFLIPYNSFADWKVNNDYPYIESWEITECSENISLEWEITWTWLILNEWDLNIQCWENNALVVQMSNTTKGGINEAWQFSISNVWVIAITILGFTLFIGLLWMIYKAFNNNKISKKSKWMLVWGKQFKKRASKVFSKKDIKTLRKKYPKWWF